MSQDYQLKKLYEQMLRGTKASNTTKSKTLQEAYNEKLISERTVFFAKDNDQYTTLGVIDDPEEAKEIKNNIKSFSIITTTSDMLKEAGWDPNNTIVSSRKLGSLFLQKEIDILDINNIQKNKASLTTLQDYIFGDKSGKKFNVIEAITQGIQKVLGDGLKTPIEKFSELTKALIPQVGRIEGTDVGPGEIAITLLSNAKKPSGKGDLNFDGKVVEAKASSYGKEEKLSGAALGYAKYASGGALQTAIDNLLRTKEASPDRALYKIKKVYDETVESLQTNGALLPLTSTFFEDLSKLGNFIISKDSQGLVQQFSKRFGMDLNVLQYSNAKVLDGIKTLLQNGYIDKKNVSLETLQSPKNDVFVGFKQLLYSGNGLFGRAKQIAKALTKLTTSSSELKETDQKPSLTVAFGDFFFSDLGFSAQQLASVLLEARPYREHNEGLLQEMQTALEGGYLKRLQRQDAPALKGLLFALHLSEYARAEEFDYLMVFNYTTGNALVIPAKQSFTNLLNFYENHKQDISFSVDFVGRQGAHKLALR